MKVPPFGRGVTLCEACGRMQHDTSPLAPRPGDTCLASLDAGIGKGPRRRSPLANLEPTLCQGKLRAVPPRAVLLAHVEQLLESVEEGDADDELAGIDTAAQVQAMLARLTTERAAADESYWRGIWTEIAVRALCRVLDGGDVVAPRTARVAFAIDGPVWSAFGGSACSDDESAETAREGVESLTPAVVFVDVALPDPERI